jgi:two-component system response regulator DesR
LVIRVLLVQDEDVVRSALAAVLDSEPDLEVVGEVSHEGDVIGMIDKQKPDVVVLHQGAGKVGQLPDAHRLAAGLGGIPVVALMGAATRAALAQAATGAVRGVVDTDAPPAELIRVIRRVAAGEHVIDPNLVVSAVQWADNPLTIRERAVLWAVAEGLKSDEIAARLLLAKGTVRNYLSVILRKTGTRTRLEAVRKAREAGWI